MKTAYGNALVSQGNNYLLKQAVSKMQSGDQTAIGYIGGSITEGDNMYAASDKITDLPGQNYSASWAYWSYKFISGKYGTGNNVKYVNAAMSGTASDLGVTRFKTDVLDKNPCLVFIEFAVNNDQTTLEKETYESMIRMALNHSSHPAVVLAMSWTGYSGGAIETYMTQLGNSYGLPVISIHKGLNAYKSQIFTYASDGSSFASNDNLHPCLNGHKLYAKLICAGISAIANKAADTQVSSLPTPSYSDRYQTMKLYQNDNSSVTKSGSIAAGNTTVAATNRSDQISGQKGWICSGNGSLTISNISAKAIIVVYKGNAGSTGTLNVTVSGGHTASVNRDMTKDNRNQALGVKHVYYQY